MAALATGLLELPRSAVGMRLSGWKRTLLLCQRAPAARRAGGDHGVEQRHVLYLLLAVASAKGKDNRVPHLAARLPGQPKTGRGT